MLTKQCHVGKRCHFAHGEEELRKREEVSIIDKLLTFINKNYNQIYKNFNV